MIAWLKRKLFGVIYFIDAVVAYVIETWQLWLIILCACAIMLPLIRVGAQAEAEHRMRLVTIEYDVKQLKELLSNEDVAFTCECGERDDR
jgi:hypothetical protein